ncbi:MAG: D-alanyl-D-alanine carboxypeptidase family protein [Candidatus Levyibacteriota bacterium]
MKKKNSPKQKKKVPLVSIAIIFLFVDVAFLCITVSLFFLTYLTFPKPVEDVSPFPVHFSYFAKTPDIQAFSKALAVYDVQGKVLLLSKNQNLRFSPASTAKIMTALVVLDHYSLNTILTVDSLPENPDSSKMGLFLGEKMTVLNLLYGMLLPSGSDAADVLALHYPGGEEAFISQMNEKAKFLGLLNTHFVDPSGYSDDNYTTAYDLSRLGAYAIADPTFADIVKTKEITVYNADNTVPYDLKNLNELLAIPGVTGIKTGFTNEAQGVLVTTFLHNKKSYVLVVLGSKDRFQDTRTLIEGIINDLRLDPLNN